MSYGCDDVCIKVDYCAGQPVDCGVLDANNCHCTHEYCSEVEDEHWECERKTAACGHCCKDDCVTTCLKIGGSGPCDACWLGGGLACVCLECSCCSGCPGPS